MTTRATRTMAWMAVTLLGVAASAGGCGSSKSDGNGGTGGAGGAGASAGSGGQAGQGGQGGQGGEAGAGGTGGGSGGAGGGGAGGSGGAVASQCDLGGPGPADQFLYAAGPAKVTVVDPRTCTVVKTITTGSAATDANASADGKLVFFTNSGNNDLTVVNTATQDVEKRMAMGTKPVHTFISPDHARMWICNDGSANVTELDIATLKVTNTIVTANGHHKMALTDGTPTWVYVSNITDGNISAIDTSDYTVKATIPTGTTPHGMDYSRLSKQVYNCSAGTKAGIDVIATQGAAANTVVKRIEDGLSARCGYLHFDEQGRYALAPSGAANTVLVIDAKTDTIVTAVPVGMSPDRAHFFGNDIALVTNVKSPDVSFIDMKTVTEVARVTVGKAVADGATGEAHRPISWSPDLKFAYVTNAFDNSVSIIDVEQRKVRGTVALSEAPATLTVGGSAGGAFYPR